MKLRCSVKGILPESHSSRCCTEMPPHSSQNVHPGETHTQYVVTETEVLKVGVGADGSQSLLSKRGDTGVRAELGG